MQTQPEHNSANALLNGLAAMLQSVLNGTPDLGQVQQLLHELQAVQTSTTNPQVQASTINPQVQVSTINPQVQQSTIDELNINTMLVRADTFGGRDGE
ncbi:MAG: hypothetical protein PHX60_15755, partial [Giesbergeria sp.]|uniref:hypothetical protein n=1 Tax=Giesbergeria sp. TaxID=2818473 RepID=UPI0026269863